MKYKLDFTNLIHIYIYHLKPKYSIALLYIVIKT